MVGYFLGGEVGNGVVLEEGVISGEGGEMGWILEGVGCLRVFEEGDG